MNDPKKKEDETSLALMRVTSELVFSSDVKVDTDTINSLIVGAREEQLRNRETELSTEISAALQEVSKIKKQIDEACNAVAEKELEKPAEAFVKAYSTLYSGVRSETSGMLIIDKDPEGSKATHYISMGLHIFWKDGGGSEKYQRNVATPITAAVRGLIKKQVDVSEKVGSLQDSRAKIRNALHDIPAMERAARGMLAVQALSNTKGGQALLDAIKQRINDWKLPG